MTPVEQLVSILLKTNRYLYHFTDTRNLPSISAHGLLPTAEIRRRGLDVVTGGDEASLAIDTHLGLDEHVHLHFCGTHPMEYRAREEGRIVNTRYIKVSPRVLLKKGVLLADQVSTANAANILPANELVPRMDFEVTYTRTDWRIPEIQARRRAAEKWEALIPGSIGLEDILAL